MRHKPPPENAEPWQVACKPGSERFSTRVQADFNILLVQGDCGPEFARFPVGYPAGEELGITNRTAPGRLAGAASATMPTFPCSRPSSQRHQRCPHSLKVGYLGLCSIYPGSWSIAAGPTALSALRLDRQFMETEGENVTPCAGWACAT